MIWISSRHVMVCDMTFNYFEVMGILILYGIRVLLLLLNIIILRRRLNWLFHFFNMYKRKLRSVKQMRYQVETALTNNLRARRGDKRQVYPAAGNIVLTLHLQFYHR